MNEERLKNFQHNHHFVRHSKQNERQVWIVLALTVVTMLAEIIAGTVYGSMALLADGWHMSTHLVAFGVTLFAWRYAYARQSDPRFSFSTGKVSVLAAYSSAIFLGVVAVLMIVESVLRFIHPESIAFDQALIVAVVGLVVNLVSALLLHHDHSETHDSHGHVSKDHNHQAAYLHVLADALTSLAAIIALLAGKWFGWGWMDPMMGIVGGVIIFIWVKRLTSDTSKILLDYSISPDIESEIVDVLESIPETKVVDFHAWKLNAEDYAVIIGLVSTSPDLPENYKARLQRFEQLKHITIEVNHCD
ncbi:cation transporter [Hydrogenovibrio sp. SC-1]|uniref:CDF family Co(II)/Ni(II) efflux transporter DmeF n=1 Tax=Hydrogenovibrio sp. SC-1 TaxID=2065820 RepID=UPI000C79C817|nr:CDF family Co(II)/Ni(II) efflux transporter DmeF [Hydrogenovibrio sp. SC-1]PLA74779.1 cation transporter [Hydrogenovibrio sp. SC-1]